MAAGVPPNPEPELWLAALIGKKEAVRQLLTEGADTEEKGECAEPAAGGFVRMAALHAAATGGHEVIVLLLLEHGASVSSIDNYGDTPLHYAATEAVAGLLLDYNADATARNFRGDTPLHHAACAGLEAAVLLLIQHGADVTATNDNGNTPERWATQGSQVAALLKAEAVRKATKCVAFASGQHPRLGERSQVLALDEGVVRMILDRV